MTSSYLLAFVVGLLSALHCVGMCGGVVGALSYSLPERIRDDWPRFAAFTLAYNLGRVLSYALAGALFGTLGGVVIEAGSRFWLQDLLRWLAAAIMVGIGLYISGWFPRFSRLERIGEPLWRWLQPIGRRLLPVTTLPRALVYGAVWGWLPCGLVYSMLLSTPAQGEPLAGAVYMALFGAGTLPVMLGTGLFAGRLYRFTGDRRLRVVSGLAVVALGLFALAFQGYN